MRMCCNESPDVSHGGLMDGQKRSFGKASHYSVAQKGSSFASCFRLNTINRHHGSWETVQDMLYHLLMDDVFDSCRVPKTCHVWSTQVVSGGTNETTL